MTPLNKDWWNWKITLKCQCLYLKGSKLTSPFWVSLVTGVWRSVFLASAIKLLLEAQLDNAHVPNGRMKPHHVCCLEMLHIEQKKMTFFCKKAKIFSTNCNWIWVRVGILSRLILTVTYQADTILIHQKIFWMKSCHTIF